MVLRRAHVARSKASDEKPRVYTTSGHNSHKNLRVSPPPPLTVLFRKKNQEKKPKTPHRMPPSNMMAPNGTNFGMNGSRGKSNGLLSFNKVDPLGRLRMTSMSSHQFPTNHRMPASLSGHRMMQAAQQHTSAGVQQSLSMLCDVAISDPVRGGAKRIAAGDFRKQDFMKRRKIDTPPMQNPKLLERVSSLGGGFPMPKWGGAKEFKPKAPEPLKLKPSLGAFPMPGMKSQKQGVAPSLSGFKNLWYDTDQDLRKEVFSRRLRRANTRVVDGRLRHDL
jgi:hypothetical protein